MQLNRRGPVDPAEEYALTQMQALGDSDPTGYVEPDDLLKFGKHVSTFNHKLGEYVAKQGWFREAPQASIDRWSGRGGIVLILGVMP